MKRIIIASIIIALLMSGTAVGTTYVTTGQIKDETITASDIGPDITRVKTVKYTLPVIEEEVTEDRCYPNEDGSNFCATYVKPEDMTVIKTIRCPTGNVTGGGLKLENVGDMWDLDWSSYPSSDSAWTFALFNAGSVPIEMQFRITCV